MIRTLRPVTVLVGGAAALLLSAAPALAAPGVTVTPSSGLAAGSKVTVTVNGFPAGSRVGVDECSPMASSNGAAACDTAHLVVITTDATGSGTGTYTIATGPIGTAAGSRCPATTGSCVITAADMANNAVAAFAQLSFAASAAAPAASGSTSSTVPGATATSTGKPFRLEVLLAAALLMVGAGFTGVAVRRARA